MFDRFLTIIKTKSLISSADKVLIAVSGGVDSMVLLDLFSQTNFDIGVAHVNYMLRDQDSKDDENLVRERTLTYDKPFFLRKVTADEWEKGPSIQMQAREIRYSFFEELRAKHGFTKICLAHHINDNIETVLLNLTKGTGIMGIAGMDHVRQAIIRPLLHFSRLDIMTYAKKRNVIWREDRSNDSNKYQRNLIRNQITPVLKSINPNLENTFTHSIRKIKGAQDVLLERVSHIEKEYLSVDGHSEILRLDWYKLNDASFAVLFEILKKYGVNTDILESIDQCIFSGGSGKKFMTGTNQILFDRNQLIMTEKLSSRSKWEKRIDATDTTVDLDEGCLSVEMKDGGMDVIKSSVHAFIDAEALQFPLKVRGWRNGDWFVPFGMKGRKKLSDYMIDLKIPVTLKEKVLVVTSNDDIVWVVGYRLDDRFKVTASTKKTLKMSLHENV